MFIVNVIFNVILIDLIIRIVVVLVDFIVRLGMKYDWIIIFVMLIISY